VHRSARGVVVDFAELSDPGRDPTKQINEDSSGHVESKHGFLAVVCDGMGGHAAGRAASQTALTTLVESVSAAPAALVPAEALKQGMEAAGRAVFAIGGEAPANLRPGSTAVALLVHDGVAEVAHVGDSRAYLLRTGSIQRLTRDHSMVQQMVEAGMIDAQRAAEHPDANKLTRALGMVAEVEVELAAHPVALRPGDVLVLASDGLTDLVSDDEILGIVQGGAARGSEAACRELVALANARGGHDNITVQILGVVEAARPRGFASTLADTDRGATRPGKTLIDSAAPPRAAPQATLPDDALHPAPTLLDQGPYPPQRTTAPDLGAPPPRSLPGAHLPPWPASGSREARATAQRRLLLLIAIAVAFVIAGGVAVWWFALAS
jgi:protein phosphatase